MILMQVRLDQRCNRACQEGGLILSVEEEVCASPGRMGQFFRSFRTGLGRKGFLSRGICWAKAGEVWKCSRKLGNSQESGLTGGEIIYRMSIRSGERKKGEIQVRAKQSNRGM